MLELTNHQRQCLGLEEISENWDRVELAEGNIIYFDENDVIRKEIAREALFYRESSLWIETQQDRTMLIPKTSRGKIKKLTLSNVLDRSSYGMYLVWNGESGNVQLANVTTQVTYYHSCLEGISITNQQDWQNWLEAWENETTEEKLREVQEFATRKRKHCHYKEGDFFRFRWDRHTFGYGRILFDVTAWTKQGNPFWNILMGRPLVVQVYHIVTQDADLSVEDLVSLPACPSQFIMDNIFYYGECEILGNLPFTGEIDYPVMYGKSISALEPDKIIFCRGKEYREFSEKEISWSHRSYLNNGIGWNFDLNKKVIEQCIQEKSNQPYWAQDLYGMKDDLRNPKNRSAYEEILNSVINNGKEM